MTRLLRLVRQHHRSLMSLILLVAALAHFVVPNVFLMAMPPYIPWHLEMIFFTGVLEVLFAFGIHSKKEQTRLWSGTLLAVYFVAILPAHIHVSIHSVPIFGVESQALLWGRTVFQSVFIWWAWLLRR